MGNDVHCQGRHQKQKNSGIFKGLQQGIVLYNSLTIHKHQKNIDEVKETGSSIRKHAKLLSTVFKKDFISVRRRMDTSTNEKSSTGKNSKAKQTDVKEEDLHSLLVET